MHNKIQDALRLTVDKLVADQQLAETATPIVVQATPPKIAGDYATNLAMVMAKSVGIKPLALAQLLVDNLPSYDWLAKAEVAPPGFINFYCNQQSLLDIVATILQQAEQYGAAVLPDEEKGKRILVEYVSANPTGPLHIGHGRAAAIGSALVNLLNFVGYQADGEYYVNDSGRQMNILTASFCLRLMQLPDIQPSLPEGFYQGDYLIDLAKQWQNQQMLAALKDAITQLLTSIKDKEQRLDQLIALLEESLGDDFKQARGFILQHMMGLIKQDLHNFRVEHDSWYYESTTVDKMAGMIEDLRQRDLLYDKEGAVWFRSLQFDDDKDRVFQRSNQQPTYFAYDIGYHHDKYLRHYDRIVDILGADHHGYMQRIRASMRALGHDPQSFDIVLVQLVFLANAAKDQLSMSTRSDRFVSLAELIEQIPVDVVRFFFLMHRADQPLNFDMALALSQTKDNPVYYVQYACARISSLFAEGGTEDWQAQQQKGLEQLHLLDDEQEVRLATKLSQFPQLLIDIARSYEVHRLTTYLCELAAEFHSYYNRVRILGEDAMLPRLCLCLAIKQTLANGLGLLGVSVPTKL